VFFIEAYSCPMLEVSKFIKAEITETNAYEIHQAYHSPIPLERDRG